MKPGIYWDIPFNEYLALPYRSKSALHEFSKSPALHKGRLDGTIGRASSADFELGSAVDAMWVEQRTPSEAGYAIRPRGLNLKTSEGKEWRSAVSPGITIVPHTVADMVRSLESNARAMELRQAGSAQATLIWDCPITGMRMKGRPDLLELKSHAVIADLKTTRSIEYHAFRSDFSKYNYHWQMCLYGNAIIELGLCETFEAWIIAVDKTPPHGVACRPVSDASLEVAAAELKKLLLKYAECALSDHWPAHDEHERPLELPRWRMT